MTTEEGYWLELTQIQAKSIGWILLDESAFIHICSN